MTEVEWLLSEDLMAMLKHVRIADYLSCRKLRLLLCGLLRQSGWGLCDTRYWNAIAVAEDCADGYVSDENLRLTLDTIARVNAETHRAHIAALATTDHEYREIAMAARRVIMHCLERPNILVQMHVVAQDIYTISACWQNAVFEMYGNPFTPRFAWQREWRTPIVAAIAREAYEARMFDDLPVLADALEDAGCDVQHLLEHLRSPLPHMRGCWALDYALNYI